jgi:uncharacterized cupin superfamily protein
MTTSAAAHRLAHYGDLVTLELAEDGPRAGATAGTPVESSKTLYADTVCEIGVWECTPGAFPGAKDGIGEHMLILAGDATVIGDDGTTIDLRPGVSFVMPDGWAGRWEVRETIRKQYTIWRTR